MKWVWLAGDGCFQLALQQNTGLRVLQQSFGYVDGKTNRAYDYWNNKDLGTFPSTIEAKRHLLEHIKNQIAYAHDDSKPQFENPEQPA